MWHLLANYNGAVAAATPTDLAPVQDEIFTVQNGHWVPQSDIYAWFANLRATTAVGVGQIVTPSLRQVSSPFIRPVSAGSAAGVEIPTADWRRNSVLLKGLEEVEVLVSQASGGSAIVSSLLGVSAGPIPPAPSGTVYTMRGVGAGVLISGVWNNVPIVWQDSLPAGFYSVIGMEYVGASAVAARLIFEQQVWRPGCPGILDDTGVTGELFTRPNLGEWGRFNSYRMPNLQFLSDAADTAQEVFLQFVRVG